MTHRRCAALVRAAALILVLCSGFSCSGGGRYGNRGWVAPPQQQAPPLAVVPAPPAPVRQTPVAPLPPVPAIALTPTAHPEALNLLVQAARSGAPIVRAHALEALVCTPASLALVAPAALGDVNPGVRFVALMAVGEARCTDLLPIVEPLLLDDNASVRCAAIFCLNSLGRQVDQTPLAEALYSSDPTLCGNGVLILGLLGNGSAAGLLREAVEGESAHADPAQSRILELQVAEALVLLGDRTYLDAIHAALFAPAEQSEMIMLGCQICGNIRDPDSGQMLLRLLEAPPPFQRPIEIRLAAAESLIQTGARAQERCLALAQAGAVEPDPLIRAQAASLFGRLGGPMAVQELERLLRDESPVVQIAASAALNRIDTGCTAR